MQFLILVFGLSLPVVTAYSSGQVTPACTSMTPQHGNNSMSTLEAPYTVTSDVSNYKDGQVITVTLQAKEIGFKGFLLQARNNRGPVGTFTLMGNNTQLLSCGAEGSAVSHTSDDVKSSIVAQWTAPNSNNTNILFRATFVQNISLFWVGVESDTVIFVETNAPNVTVSPPNATVSTPHATVSTPNATVSTPNATVSTPNATVSTPNATVSTPHATDSTTKATDSTTNSRGSTTTTRFTTPERTTNDSPSMSLTCLLLLPLLAII